MATYTYPESVELIQVEQEFISRLEANRPVFDFFPRTSVDSHLLRWEQKDNYFGLQQIRGLNGEPPKVKRVGHKQYQMAPGVYGEFVTLDELELTSRRQIGTFAEPIDVSDLIMEAEEHLLARELDRIELIIWTLLSTGTFSVSNIIAAVTHLDTYTIQTFTAGVVWATSATAVPLANFRSVQLLSRGKGVNFGAQAKALMNRTTFNQMVTNTNQNDLAGRRASGLLSVLSLNEINSVLAGEDLPQVMIYDEGYIDESATFQLFIPNNKVIVIGQRPNNQPVGEYRFTRNVNNPDMGPGPYTKIIDGADAEDPPRKIRVHRGHNGGPAIYWPSAVVSMTV